MVKLLYWGQRCPGVETVSPHIRPNSHGSDISLPENTSTIVTIGSQFIHFMVSQQPLFVVLFIASKSELGYFSSDSMFAAVNRVIIKSIGNGILS